MPTNHQLSENYENRVRTILFKASFFTQREIEALLTLALAVIGSHFFSLRMIAKESNGRFSRKFLSQTLQKYALVQRKLARLIFLELVRGLPRAKKFFLLLDDTLITKRGKQIFGAKYWHNHTEHRAVWSICVVTLAVVVQNTVIFLLPWMLSSGPNMTTRKLKKGVEQDSKAAAAILMLQEVLGWFNELTIGNTRITVLADSWFSSKQMRNAFDRFKVKYRIDSKKSYSVQMPDFQKISRAKLGGRGRKIQNKVKYISIERYFGTPKMWHYFIDSASGEKVFYNVALLTLKTWGRARIYAFLREGLKNPKYVLTPPLRKQIPKPQQVYSEYAMRWRIEEAHRELKQEFGFGNCQCREAWTVHGFLGLVTDSYSLWKQEVYRLSKNSSSDIKCPSWANWFFQNQHCHCRCVTA